MRDLHLWRSLKDRSYTPEEIIGPLRELASWPLHERLPFLGFLGAAAGPANANFWSAFASARNDSPIRQPVPLVHPNPEVRAAALAALGGAQGRLALQQIIAALNDADRSVR